MRDLASNEGQGNTGMQIGMGMEMGKLFGQLMGHQMQTQSVPPSTNTPPATDDFMEKLGKLKKMFEMGLINEEEYTAKKQEILSQL